MTDELTAVQPAAPDDVPHIVAMIYELGDYEQLRHLVSANDALLHQALFGARPSCECLVAHVDGAPAGFALYFHNFSTFLTRHGLYLEDVYVRPAYRGRGLATAMMRELARIALERGCGRFEWSVLDWNERAIRMFQRMGATVMDEWRFCRVSGDALVRLGATPGVGARGGPEAG